MKDIEGEVMREGMLSVMGGYKRDAREDAGERMLGAGGGCHPRV